MTGEVFFTSDLHFGHHNILKYSYRPFEDVDEMNEAIITNWNNTVGHDDIVVVLGDVFMGKRAETMPLGARLNGRKFLVPGNHDNCHPMFDSADKESKHNKFLKACKAFEDVGFTITFPEFDTELPGGPSVTICHFPFDGDHDENNIRYPEWRPQDRGQWLVHGHVHEMWKVNGRQINVGMDVWDYTPVHVDQLLELMQ